MVEKDIVTRLHLFLGQPSVKTHASHTAKPILDDWHLVGANGLKGFNSRCGGKGTTIYLIGWDKHLSKQAQQFIPDYATQKREQSKKIMRRARK